MSQPRTEAQLRELDQLAAALRRGENPPTPPWVTYRELESAKWRDHWREEAELEAALAAKTPEPEPLKLPPKLLQPLQPTFAEIVQEQQKKDWHGPAFWVGLAVLVFVLGGGCYGVFNDSDHDFEPGRTSTPR